MPLLVHADTFTLPLPFKQYIIMLLNQYQIKVNIYKKLEQNNFFKMYNYSITTEREQKNTIFHLKINPKKV